MNTALSFQDVLITPQFSSIESRKDVDTSVTICGRSLHLPVISSNMDTVTEASMAEAMHSNGAIGSLHRFCSIEDNVKMFLESKCNPIVSIGIGDHEYERAIALSEVGASVFLIDVAHGAATHVVNQYDRLRQKLGDNVSIIVGNFATKEGINAFTTHSKVKKIPDAWKVGIGGGSMCLTRVVTGCGLPTLASIFDCSRTGYTLIADGGIRNSGDFSKALAAGASAVMIGYLLAGTDETPGTHWDYTWGGAPNGRPNGLYKAYRGSASLESYKIQGKVSDHRTPEGESTLVQCKGPVKDILQNLSSGLRSSMSYVGASNLIEFKEKAKFVAVTQNGSRESSAHGINN